MSLRARFSLVLFVGLFGSMSARAQLFPAESELDDCSQAPPTAFGDLEFTTDTISDSTILLQPTATLPAPVRIGTYAQAVPPFATDTDLSGYQINAARAVTSLTGSFGGPVELTFAYDESQLSFPEAELELFALEIPSGQWVALSATVNASLDTISATITAPALYGLGGTGPVGVPITPVGVPIASPWLLLLLTLLVVASGLWIINSRGRVLPTLAASLLLIAAPVLVFAIQAEFTTPGNKHINHYQRLGNTTEVNIGSPPKPYLCVQSQFWRYKGAGNVQDQNNWVASIPRVRYLPKTATVAAPNRGDANAVGDYDVTTYPYYNCAGYAVRSSEYTILDAGSTQNILDNEYDLEGNFGDGNFMEGDVVTYKKNGVDTHVAVVTAVDGNGKITKCRSKWGDTHIVDHSPGGANVPTKYGEPAQVYRKK